jgi:hypothetical protein
MVPPTLGLSYNRLPTTDCHSRYKHSREGIAGKQKGQSVPKRTLTTGLAPTGSLHEVKRWI